MDDLGCVSEDVCDDCSVSQGVWEDLLKTKRVSDGIVSEDLSLQASWTAALREPL